MRGGRGFAMGIGAMESGAKEIAEFQVMISNVSMNSRLAAAERRNRGLPVFQPSLYPGCAGTSRSGIWSAERWKGNLYILPLAWSWSDWWFSQCFRFPLHSRTRDRSQIQHMLRLMHIFFLILQIQFAEASADWGCSHSTPSRAC